MAVLTWNNYKVSSFRWNKMRRDVVFSSIFGSQALEGGSPLWEADLQGVPQVWPEAHQMVAFLESFEGYRNQLALWNLAQPYPIGTMRGTIKLAFSAAKGAGELAIYAGSGQAGKTLLAGDLLGVGSGLTQQVVRVMEGEVATGSGDMTISISPPLRNAFAADAVVTWDRPKALFRQKSANAGIEYTPGIGQPWSLSLVEDWRP